MATAAELQAFADGTSFAIPTIDYQAGVSASVALKSFLLAPTEIPGVVYNPTTSILHVKADNAVLSGYDFSGVTVSVEANNVTISNSKFDASFGVYAIIQATGKSGLVVDHNTFDGLKLDRPFADFINGGTGQATITYNAFLNAPADAIQLKQGVIDHNYFSGAGYQTGAHADAISIDGSTGPITITNNFIDSRPAADAPAAPTSAIAVGNYFGDNHEITVANNVLLGGAYTVYVTDFGVNSYQQVSVQGNLVGSGLYGDLYPDRRPAELSYSGNELATIGSVSPPPASTGAVVSGTTGIVGEILQGTDGADHIFGHGDGDHIIGGGGRDFLFGGKGADIFVYKSAADSSGKLTDIISGFQDGVDKIDLQALATAAVPLTFIGDAAFSGAKGAVHAIKTATSTWVEVDLNGDKAADLRIELLGGHSLTKGDFELGSFATPTPAPAPPVESAVSMRIQGKAGVIGELLQGGSAQDWIYGHGDNNVIVGSGGRDFLIGGRGTDIFTYRSVNDSSGTKVDVIGGFQDGIDKIDLHLLATPGTPLSFIGGNAFNGVAGALHAVQSGASTWVEADMNGDKVADLRIELQGQHHLSAIDFIV